MKKTRICLVLVLIIMILLSACEDIEDNKNELDFSGNSISNIENLKGFRKPFLLPEKSIEEYIDKGQTVDEYLRLKEKVDYSKEYDENKKLSFKEIEEDVTELFDNMKSLYTGYKVQGGDEKFKKVKSKVLIDIYDGMPAWELENLLGTELDFLEDSHFYINDYAEPDSSRIWFSVKDLEFFMKDKGLYSIEYSDYIKDHEYLEEYLQESITDEGKPSYILAVYGSDMGNMPKSLELENGGTIKLNFTKLNSKDRSGAKIEHRDYDGIKYLNIPRFYKPEDGKEVKAILDAMEDMSQSEISILDLRGCPGGDGILSRQMVELYSGEKAVSSRHAIYRLSEKSFQESSQGQTWESFLQAFDVDEYDENYVISKASKDIIEKNGLLMILIDRETKSAGEDIMDSLKHVTNTVIVGTPTGGCLNGSNNFVGVMKNSHITYGFGNAWNVFNEDYFKEYKGLRPDIWMEDYQIKNIIDLIESIK